MKRNIVLRKIVEAGVIASIYAALGMLPYSSTAIQVRVSEALTVLPYLTSSAIPGLFIGCIITNIIATGNIIDIVFGSLATLIAAILTRNMPNKLLAPLPPVLINAVVVGIILHFTAGAPLFFTMLTVGIGQMIACYVLGYPLLVKLEKIKDRLFMDKQ